MSATPNAFSRGIPAVTAAEMREIDRISIDRFGTPGDVLMERAGEGATAALRRGFRTVLGHGVVIVAGKGNNGGDGFVMARLLRKARIRTTVFLVARGEALAGDAARNYQRYARGRSIVREIEDVGIGALAKAIESSGVVVDALYGTGLRGDVRGLGAEVIELLNASPVPIFAVDVPSGLDSDRGRPLGTAVQATATATFAFPKVGLLLSEGLEHAGEITVVDIGISAEAVAAVEPKQVLVTADLVGSTLPPRNRDTHKGTYGHVLLLAGSAGTTGAALLAARGALRSGAGLATLASPVPELASAPATTPELMTAALPGRKGAWTFSPNRALPIRRAMDGKSAIVFGPGIGVRPATRALGRWLLDRATVPLVIDADGLSCLAEKGGGFPRHRGPVVLTPHPGEMARLTGMSTAEVQADRVGTARSFAERHRVVVVLKGARTVVAEPGGRVAIIPTGNPGMATGGMGDVLAGVIGGVITQGADPAEAAAAGAYWHGAAADRVARRRGEAGMLASDVIEELPPALSDFHASLFGDQEPR